jgi:hypothetical protein
VIKPKFDIDIFNYKEEKYSMSTTESVLKNIEEITEEWWKTEGLRHYDPQNPSYEAAMKWAFEQGARKIFEAGDTINKL